MMLFHPLRIDERTRQSTAHAAAIWLGVTQVLLVGVIFYRLYVLGQPDEEITDFRVVMAISIFGYLGLQLFLGGVLPVPTWQGAIVSWLALSAVIAGVCLAIYGVPEADEWANTWLPVLLGPALMIAAYIGVSRLGQRRLERQLERLNS